MLTAMFLKSLLVSLTIPALIGAAPTLPSDVHKNIIGGTPAKTDEFPFIVSVQKNGFHFCGGFLVNADTVITAAHCIFDQDASSLAVRAGSMKTATGGVLVTVDKIIIIPGFRTDTLRNDIAIMKLHASVHRSSSVAYATLARKGYKPRAGTVLTAAGWGSINATHLKFPDQLYKVNIPVITKGQCRVNYVKEVINKSQFCAMARGGEKDACKGDSGGPMVDSHNTVIGIVSWGKDCASHLYPGIYTNIGSFHDFIKKY